MVNITIDGNQIEVPEGTTVLQAARTAGVSIPTLCDHPRLTPYGGCRLCLVEIEGARVPQPACTMPASSNMVIRTDTPKIREARKFVLTLIFSERNHFCMYCQKTDGDCELQNCAYNEGMTHWPLQTNWQPFPVDASHKYFVLDHNRCILCRRCVRACAEMSGNFTLGFEERGANSMLMADLGTPLGESTCISCGSCVQVCPTGALIDRNSAYLGQDAQVTRTRSVCLGCSVGCGIEVNVRDNQVMRVDGDWDASVNNGVLCQLGRFAPLDEDRERIVTPLVRKDGVLKAATWEDALNLVSSKLTALKGQNGKGVAAMASTRLSAESLNLFQNIFQGLGSGMITSTEEGAFTAASSAVARELGKPFEGSLSVLQTADVVLSLGIDLAADSQVAGFFVKRAVPNGLKLILVDTQTSALAGLAEALLKPAKDTELDLIQGLSAAVVEMGLAKAVPAAALPGVEAAAAKTGLSAAALRAAARLLAEAASPALVYGKNLGSRQPAAVVKALVELARLVGALTDLHSAIVGTKGQANSLAAAQYGLDQPFEINGQQAAYLALADEQPNQRTLLKLEHTPFVVVQASHVSAATARADVVLPAASWTETTGHFLNMEGRLQEAHASTTLPEGVWTNEMILEGIAARVGAPLDAGWQETLARVVAPAPLQIN